MKSLESVREALLDGLTPLAPEWVPIQAASGRRLAETPRARVALPPFDNAAMDGVAVRVADLRSVPASLRLVDDLPAGAVSHRPLGAGEAIRVFTGAPLPQQADAVVMQEDTEGDPGDPGRIRILEAPKPWENIRFQGEDVRQDAELLGTGVHLGPGGLALLVAAGVDRVRVWPRPRVAIRVTGNELAPPGSPLPPGGIYESNGLMLSALIREAGGEPRQGGPVRDTVPAVRAALESAAASADLVLTAGGASVGEHDLVRRALVEAGGTVEEWRLAIKPGKPFFHGRLQGCPVLGVPGNPVSAFVTAVLLVLPALRRLQGATEVLPPTVPGVLEEPLSNGDGRRHFVRVRRDVEGRVKSAGVQGSHRLASLGVANGLVDVPPHTHLETGTPVAVICW